VGRSLNGSTNPPNSVILAEFILADKKKMIILKEKKSKKLKLA